MSAAEQPSLSLEDTGAAEDASSRRAREIAEAVRLIRSGGPRRRLRQRDAAERLARVLRESGRAASGDGAEPGTGSGEPPIVEVLARLPIRGSASS